MKKKKRLIIILAIAIVVVALVAVYLTFFYYKNCTDISCFNSQLGSCSKASYIDDKDDAAWQYQIRGMVDGKCKINVVLLQLKQGSSTMAVLQGKAMDCYLAKGVYTSPQSDLNNCHGILKEEMQRLMIDKLFNYITANIGQIKEELTKTI